MTTRIAARFASLKREGRAALVAYVMASDPDQETCAQILRGLPGAGADVIELGFPFSDPMADGPSIQKAAQRALKAGGSLKRTLELVRGFREHDKDTPVILMGYANPVEQFAPGTAGVPPASSRLKESAGQRPADPGGYEAFADAMHDAGADGAIIVDLPPEEDAPLRVAFAKQDLSVIRLVTPTTDDNRLTKVLEGASGFVYYVSVAGVTGAAGANTGAVRTAVERLKRGTDLPIAVGFGVREPEAARAIAQTADAVVVGSAFVDEIAASGGQGTVERVLRKVGLLSEAVRLARNTRDEGKRA